MKQQQQRHGDDLEKSEEKRIENCIYNSIASLFCRLYNFYAFITLVDEAVQANGWCDPVCVRTISPIMLSNSCPSGLFLGFGAFALVLHRTDQIETERSTRPEKTVSCHRPFDRCIITFLARILHIPVRILIAKAMRV